MVISSDHEMKLPFSSSPLSNPEVQERALLYQALPNLLTLLSPTSSDVLQRRALYALGSLLRGQPLAVEDFVSMGGIDRVSSSIEQRSEAVVIKIMTLLTDLLGFEVHVYPPFLFKLHWDYIYLHCL